MNRSAKRKEVSTGVIVLWFILFFPVGIYLLFKKQTSDKSDTAQNYKIRKVYGWIFIVIGFIYLMMITEDDDMMLAWFIFTILGSVLLINAKKFKKLNKIKVEYSRIIGMNQVTSLDYIASITNTSYEKVLDNMNKLIDLQVLDEGYIDYNRHMYINPIQYSAKGNVVRPAVKSINCKNCGANNSVMVGTTSECEYCGSQISI